MFVRARLLQHGWDADLHIERSAALPQPEAGQVRVRVGACGVAYRDVIDRSGRVAFMRVPITMGHEAAGVVEALGEGVTQWQVGDTVATMHRDFCGACRFCDAGETSLCQDAFHVFGLLADGGFASHLVAPENALYRVPQAMPVAHAAVLLSAWGTAWRGLHKFGPIGPGHRVVVTGANGGVGSAAVQLATRLGAEVVGVVRDEKHADFVSSQGAFRVATCSDGRYELGAWQADLALDCVGAATFASSMRALRLGGGLVAIGNIQDAKVPLSIGRVIVGGLKIAGSTGATRSDMASLLDHHGQRPLNFPIAATYPLTAADQAMRKVRAGGNEGRVVLDCHAA